MDPSHHLVAGLSVPLGGLMHARVRPWPGRISQADTCCDLLWADERLYVCGPQSIARQTRHPDEEIEVMNLDPLLARRWLGLPLGALTDQAIPLEDVAPRDAGRLSELFSRGDARMLVRTAHSESALEDLRWRKAAFVLRRTGSVRRAARSVELSERQIERAFRDCFGLPPKRYAMIVRMRRAVRAARHGLSLAAAAADAGYVDQAHLNRDVRLLAGCTPTALLPNVGVSQDRIVDLRS